MMIILKKFLVILKNYWYIPVILIGIIIMLVITGGKSSGGLFEILKKANESHKKEVSIINEVHAEETQKKEENLKVFHETVKSVEEKYKADKKKLSKKKKKEIKKTIEKNRENPAALADELADLMGFQVVKAKEDA